jgi:hypothetical protein
MYEFRKVTADRECIIQCSNFLRSVFTGSNNFTEEYLKWEYKDNPVGEVIGFNAFESNELVAHYAAQPVIANLFGKDRKGLLSINNATHPKHWGKKLFITLADMTHKYGVENGFDFVFGVSGEYSLHGFLYKLDFQYVAPLQVKLGIGELKKRKEEKSICFERKWTNDLLKWRLNSTKCKYEINGKYIYANAGKYGVKTILGNFDEILFNNISSSKIFSLNPVKLYIGLDPGINWNKSKYYEVPKKKRPSPLYLIFKDLTGNNLLLDQSSVKFQNIDFDAY